MLKNVSKQFCLNTSLHGYKFIVLPKRILLERCLWLILSIAALVGAVVLSLEAWNGFQEDPTITITDSTHHPIWNYHFPAVTICNINTISSKAVWSLIANLTIPSHITLTNEELHEEFRLLYQLINPENIQLPLKKLERLQDIFDHNKMRADEVLSMVSADCELIGCKWKGEEKRCESIFEKVKTVTGYCCSFNYFAGKNHTFKGDSPLKAPKRPRRVSACGYRTALEIILNNTISDYYVSTIPTLGYMGVIHHPYEFPDWSSKFMLMNEKSITFLSSTPVLTYATEEIKKLDLSQRKCLFADERQLKIHAKYSFHNCITECRLKLFEKYCGCTPFYLYSDDISDSNNPPKICNLRDIPCIQKHRNKIVISFIGNHFDRDLLPHRDFGPHVEQCKHCFADCEYMEYPFEYSSGTLEANNSNEIFLINNLDKKNYTVLKVFFNDLVGTRNRRDVHYNWHTLLGLFGGILGLFIGFSFVSVFEVLYFFIIRILLSIKKTQNVDKNVKASSIKRTMKDEIKTVNVKYNDSKNFRSLPRRKIFFQP